MSWSPPKCDPALGEPIYPVLLLFPKFLVQAQFPPQAAPGILGIPAEPLLAAHFQTVALQGDRRFCYFSFPNAFQVTVSCQERWRHPNCTHTQLSPGSPKNTAA